MTPPAISTSTLHAWPQQNNSAKGRAGRGHDTGARRSDPERARAYARGAGTKDPDRERTQMHLADAKGCGRDVASESLACARPLGHALLACRGCGRMACDMEGEAADDLNVARCVQPMMHDA